MQKIISSILNILFPSTCLSCEIHLEGDRALCENCFSKIEINNSFFCPECSRRLPSAEKNCHKKEKFILASAVSFQDPIIRKLIHALKYRSLKLAKNDIQLIFEKYIAKIEIKKFLSKDWTIIPIPLHPAKERERGFNQAETIAIALKELIPDIQINKNILLKIRKTPSQTEAKGKDERAKNIEDCFAITPNSLKLKNIILVDDVFTSGATMREAVKTLKSVKAKKVIALTVART